MLPCLLPTPASVLGSAACRPYALLEHCVPIRNVPALPFRRPSYAVTAMVWGTTLPPQPVILQLHPLQRNTSPIFLMSLLPYRKTATSLPTEIWTKIPANMYYGDNANPTPNIRRRAEQYRRDWLLICKALAVRLNNPLISFRLLLMASRAASLRWPTSAQHRTSRILLSCVDTVALAIGQVRGQVSCCRQVVGFASEDTLLDSRTMGPRP